MTRIVIFFLQGLFFLIYPGYVFAESITDSLKHELNKSISIEKRIEVLKLLGEEYGKSSLDSSLVYFEEALQIAIKEKNEQALAQIYNNMGVAYNQYNITEKSLYYFLASLKIKQKYGNRKEISNSLNNIGTIYARTNQYEVALEYFLKSLEIKLQIQVTDPSNEENNQMISGCLNNIGLLYDQLGDRQNALIYLNKSLDLSGKLNDKTGIGRALVNIGDIYFDSGQYDLALEKYIETRKIYADINDYAFAECGYKISKVYQQNGLIKKSLDLADETMKMAKKLNGLYMQRDIYKLLAENYSKEKDYFNAYMNFQNYSFLNDSLQKIDHQDKISEMQIIHETEKKEQKIQQLRTEKTYKEKELQFHENITLFLTGLIIVLGVSAFIIFFQKKQLQNSYRKLVSKNLEIIKSEKRQQKEEELMIQDPEKTEKNEPAYKYSESKLTKEDKERLSEMIRKAIENESLYLKADFTINDLARHINISRSYISQVINEYHNQHFNQFINEFRIKEAMKMFSDPENRLYTIASIASTVGFNSLSTFNIAFKKYTGVTPSYFLKSLKR